MLLRIVGRLGVNTQSSVVQQVLMRYAQPPHFQLMYEAIDTLLARHLRHVLQHQDDVQPPASCWVKTGSHISSWVSCVVPNAQSVQNHSCKTIGFLCRSLDMAERIRINARGPPRVSPLDPAKTEAAAMDVSPLHTLPTSVFTPLLLPTTSPS